MKKIIASVSALLLLASAALAFDVQAPADLKDLGCAFGVYGSMPILKVKNPYCPIELGLQNGPTRTVGMVKLQGDMLEFQGDESVLHVGLTTFLSNDQAPVWGTYIGVESFLNSFVSFSVDLYPLTTDWATSTIPCVFIGAKVYL